MDLRTFFCILLLVVFYMTLDPKGLKDKWQSTGSTGCILSKFMTPKSCMPNPYAWTLIIFGGIWDWVSSKQYDKGWWSGPGLEQFMEASYLLHEVCTACQGQAYSCQLYMILSRPHHIPDHLLPLRPTYTLSLSQLLTFLHVPPPSYYPWPCTKLYTPISCHLTKLPGFFTNQLHPLLLHLPNIFAESTNYTLSLSLY